MHNLNASRFLKNGRQLKKGQENIVDEARLGSQVHSFLSAHVWKNVVERYREIKIEHFLMASTGLKINSF